MTFITEDPQQRNPIYPPHDAESVLRNVAKAWERHPEVKPPEAVQNILEAYREAVRESRDLPEPPRPDVNDVAALGEYLATIDARRKAIREAAQQRLASRCRELRAELREQAFAMESAIVDAYNQVLNRVDAEIAPEVTLPRDEFGRTLHPADYSGVTLRWAASLPKRILGAMQDINESLQGIRSLRIALGNECVLPWNVEGCRGVFLQLPGVPPLPPMAYRPKGPYTPEDIGHRLYYGETYRAITAQKAYEYWAPKVSGLVPAYAPKK